MRRRMMAGLLVAAALVGAPACGDGSSQGAVGDAAVEGDAAKSDDAAEGDAATQDDATAADTVEDTQLVGDPTCESRDDLVVLVDGLSLNLLGGVSEAIAIDVPAGAVAVTAAVIGDEDGMYTIESWKAGAVDLVTAGWMSSDKGTQLGVCLGCKNRVSLSEAASAAIVPNNPDASLPPGEHVLRVAGMSSQGAPKNGAVQVQVYAKVLPSAPTTGRLDLNLHFTGARGWTAATAQDDPEFLAILDEVRGIYGQVGVTLGDITWQDVDEKFRVIETLQGPGSDLMEMFRASSANELNAANLFFVDELTSPFGVVLGVAGGVPGPPMMQGTSRSGVAVVVNSPPGMADSVATTMAHELGHFLGLFHTSENELFAILTGGPVHDPLPDTPESDNSWLMHNQGVGHKLSEWQGRIIRSNPWVCHPEGL